VNSSSSAVGLYARERCAVCMYLILRLIKKVRQNQTTMVITLSVCVFEIWKLSDQIHSPQKDFHSLYTWLQTASWT
jgi:hypothetical protein